MKLSFPEQAALGKMKNILASVLFYFILFYFFASKGYIIY